MSDLRPSTQRRKQTDYHKLVAKTHDGDFVFLDYIFDEGSFKGATGSVFTPISKDEYAERTDVENLTERFEDLWRMQVSEGKVTEGLNEYVEDLMRYESAEDLAFDTSYAFDDIHWPQMRAKGFNEDEWPFFECTGGGRCFDAKNDYAEVYEPGLLKLIEKAEAK